MRYLNRLSTAQRIIVVVGLGVAFIALGNYLVSLNNPVAGGGFFGYSQSAPLVALGGAGLAPWLQLLIWLGLILVWTAIAAVVMRRPTAANDGTNERL